MPRLRAAGISRQKGRASSVRDQSDGRLDRREIYDPEELESYIARGVIASRLAAVVVLDIHGGVVELSGSAEELLRVPRAEALGRELAELVMPPAAREAHRHGLRQFLETGRSELLERWFELAVVRTDGTEFPAEMSLTAVGSPDGIVFVGFIRDITSRRASMEHLAQSQALLAQAEELSGAGSFERDLRTGRVVWSAGMRRVLGLPDSARAGWLDEQLVELSHPADRELARALAERLERERPDRFEQQLRIIRPDGIERAIEITGRLDRDAFGQPIRIVGTARDVTDELASRAERDMLSHVVESSDDAILTSTADGTITSWNRGAERLFGYSAEEAVGNAVSMITPVSLMADDEHVARQVFAGEAVHRDEVQRVRKDGSAVIVSMSISPVRDAVGRIVSAAVIARDVTERNRYEARLQYLAEHDHLTGLLNRRRFEEELERELSRSSRSGEQGAVLSVDLDGFKSVNDLAGHAAGDVLLTKVARSLVGNTRASDVVARLGGDEFAVLLPNTGPERARVAAAKLLDALHGCSVNVGGTPFRATASIGVAMFTPGETRVHDLVVDADMAMYSAKQSGRDRIAVFTATEAQEARTDARTSWSHQIRYALANDGLLLYSQPIFDLADGRLTHSELLLRMHGSGGQLILPQEFLRSAERLGLIHAIDHWVVTRAVQLLAELPSERRRPVSVNLSAESVAGDPGLLGLIRSELDVAGVDPIHLVFELTETAAISNIEEARAFAQGIRRLGCRLALDDFGTGFGSFYHLKHLPVDYIKIDQEFVHELAHSDVDQRLVGSIVEVATALGIETVAEAVGDQKTVQLLRELGVDYGQGYFLGEPAPLEDDT